MNAASIELEQFYAHPPAAVWRALTDPARLAVWWAPGDIRPVVGHRFEMDMGPWGKQACVVTVVEEPKKLQYRFAEGRLDTTLTWTLTAENGGTRLRLVHEGFDLDNATGKMAYEGMKPGWPGVLKRLGESL